MTVDCLVESVHFFAADPIDTVARKLVRVNVSDIHAKGALPREALLVLGIDVVHLQAHVPTKEMEIDQIKHLQLTRFTIEDWLSGKMKVEDLFVT